MPPCRHADDIRVESNLPISFPASDLKVGGLRSNRPKAPLDSGLKLAVMTGVLPYRFSTTT
jgi:hypothetical protein